MTVLKRPDVVIGALSGLLLFATAVIPNCGAWPFIWPLLGGAAAVVWIARHRVERTSLANALGIGVVVGAVAAVVAIAGCVAILPFILPRAILTTTLFSKATLGISVAMLLAVPVAIVGSALAGTVLKVRRRDVP